MKYFMVIMFFCLLPGYAASQVAKVTSQGTTVYYSDGDVYTPNNNVETVPLQPQYLGSYNGAVQYEAVEKEVNINEQNLQDMKNNPLLKMVRGSLKNTANQRTARNLLVLSEVAYFKLGDERLKKDVEEVSQNQEYLRKIEIIKNKLSNNKISDNKNKEALRILNDAGNRLYNLLAN